MLVYLAAAYPRRDELKSAASLLREAGFTVTSRWLKEDLPLNVKLGDCSPKICETFAIVDLEDIEKANTLLFFSENPNVGVPRGSRHVEFGFALGRGKRVCVLGGHENVFQYLPQIVHYSDLDSFIEGEAQ